MAIRHIVVMKFREGTTPDAVQALADALRGLPAVIPEIVDYRVGPDLGLADDSWDFAVSADFDDVDGFRTYREHPDHLAIIRDLIAPHVESRHSVQFDT
ncbi:MAG: Dabb family protein [Acidimicrobiales bacterium]|nr:Dabb family protein [Acidimicrobiales bacterium]